MPKGNGNQINKKSQGKKCISWSPLLTENDSHNPTDSIKRFNPNVAIFTSNSSSTPSRNASTIGTIETFVPTKLCSFKQKISIPNNIQASNTNKSNGDVSSDSDHIVLKSDQGKQTPCSASPHYYYQTKAMSNVEISSSASTSLVPRHLPASSNYYDSSRLQDQSLGLPKNCHRIEPFKSNSVTVLTHHGERSQQDNKGQENIATFYDSIVTIASASQNEKKNIFLSTLPPSLKKENTQVERNEDTDDDGDVALYQISRPKRYIIMFGLFLSVLLAAMDQTIVAVVLSNIGAQFDALSSTAWLGTAYLITITALQPLYGKLSDIMGRLPILLSALGIFLVGSALCATAQSMIWLIIARGVTGIGGSGIFSMAMIIASDITTAKNRSCYISFFSFSWTIVSVTGPLLGGVFADKVTWRWCFYINLPIGAVTVLISLLFLRIPARKSSWKEKLKRIDFLGSLVIVAGLIVLLLALSWGGKEHPWSSPAVISLLIVGLVLLIAFVLVEAYVSPEPILKLNLLKSYSMLALIIAILTSGMVLFSLIYYLPLFFSVTQNSSTISSGLHLLPFQVSVSVFALASGYITSYTGKYRLVTLFGFLCATVGAGIVTLLRPDSTADKQIGYLILCGIGVGLTLSPTVVLGQYLVKPDSVAIITGFLVFIRSIGDVLGLAMCDSIFKNSLLKRLNPIASRYPGYSNSIFDSQNNASVIWVPDFPSDIRNEIVDAYGQALRQIFIAMVPLSAIGFVASLIVRQDDRLYKKAKKDDSDKTFKKLLV
ncbi:hypothetical protein H4219_001389 [Mycoemilia scoparia]|uniref:Major facilitator superfamily (MFS) profile domain-containing protein n=1 Tax=Mycoemilia scoparia TaxID=417184 RepID=A0A9W8A9S5_9FUNG|nr:hypothetical protein H4219_001389 [Mycoemilia scoparia]